MPASSIGGNWKKEAIMVFQEGEYEQYDALGLAELVRQRQVTPLELLEEAIARVEARDGTVNAVVTKMYDQARAAIAAGLPAGRFTGVPFMLKDLGVLYHNLVTTGPVSRDARQLRGALRGGTIPLRRRYTTRLP
jgi:hypothetical protein